jgi:YD repeat-containing protein
MSWLGLAAWRRGMCVSALLLCCLSSWVGAQGTSQYVYDDDGRLRAVIAPSGDAAVYEYDAAGNFTAIRRLAANDLELISFAPRSGVVGTRIVFYGTGFGAGVSSVTFAGGATGTLVGFTNNVITAIVPAGAVTGPITIATARGQLTTLTPFVVQGIVVNPAEVSALDGESIQFNATVILPGDEQEISWSVNGIVGGNATIGSVTSTGLYTAPPDPLASFDVALQATSVAFPEIAGLATVHVRSLSDFRFALSTGVSVGKGPAFANASALSQGVSIGKGPNYQNAGALSRGVSVGKGPGFADAAFGGGVSLLKGPIISAIAPNSVARGNNVNVTVSGSGFSGTTEVRMFRLDGSFPSGVTISNIVVAGDGNSLTFDLHLFPSADIGRKILVVITPVAHSVSSNVNVNTIEITGP